MSDESGTYSAAALKKTKWGKIAALDGGKWETVWDLSFTSEVPDAPVNIHEDADIGFSSTLEPAQDGSAVLRIVTRRHAMSPEYYSPTFTSFRIVNDDVAEVLTIQGLPRDWYAPFRDRHHRRGTV
jgi:hypothetical protein